MGQARRRRLGWWLAAGVLACCGCSNQDTDRLTQVAQLVAAKVQNMTGGSDGKVLSGWQTLRGNLDAASLESRVRARLYWDKALEDALIDVRAHDGQVELIGTVHDLGQRRRAVELADSTAGAVQVIDALTVPPAWEP